MSTMKHLCEQYGFHPDAVAFLDAAYRKLEGEAEAFAVFQEQVEQYRQNYLFEHKPVFAALHALEETTGIHRDTIDLMYMIRLLPILQELYKREGLDEDMFYGFVGNVKESQGGGKNFYGTSVAWWFIDFYKLKLFTIGRLQFRRRRLMEDVRCGDLLFAQDTYYLDVHIPGGGPLLPELCQDAYARAAEFFRKRNDMQTVVFSCYSWLLSPDLDEMLPPHSNILAFAHQYTLSEAVPDEKYSHLTFAFGVQEVPEDLSALPEDTSLRRKLKAWLLAGNCLRLGKGFFLYSKA